MNKRMRPSIAAIVLERAKREPYRVENITRSRAPRAVARNANEIVSLGIDRRAAQFAIRRGDAVIVQIGRDKRIARGESECAGDATACAIVVIVRVGGVVGESDIIERKITRAQIDAAATFRRIVT